jgi:uncharacterized protein (TIGR02757 family)
MTNFFDHIYEKYNVKEYIPTDPILFPHTMGGNQEFVAFTAAMFAYGNVNAMQKFLRNFFETCGTDPIHLNPNPNALKYRFQTSIDVAKYCLVMKDIYKDYGSLENLFNKNISESPITTAMSAFELIRGKYFSNLTQGLNFLFAMPGKSASKRLWMYLRWMIRKDNVDIGLWSIYKPSQLNFPLDTHISRMSTSLNIISPNDKPTSAIAKIHAYFHRLSPQDPVKYDFALTRLGIAHKCKYEYSESCAGCGEWGICVFG